MENVLKGMGEDYLGLTVFWILFLILILFKQSVLISLKEIDFLKLCFQLRSLGFFFDRKRKRLGLLSSHERSPENEIIFFKSCFSINIENRNDRKRKVSVKGNITFWLQSYPQVLKNNFASSK